MKINKWFIPILIVAVNALAVIVKWSSLPELLPAHFDLQGNAGGTMDPMMLYFMMKDSKGDTDSMLPFLLMMNKK